MPVKSYPKSNNLQTDAFLNEPVKPDMLIHNAARRAITEIQDEIRPIILCPKPNFTQAIKAARKVNRKTYTRRFMMRLIGSILIMLAILIVFSSCKYTPAPNVYEAKGFSTSTDLGNDRIVRKSSPRGSNYKTPIVGIFHPHNDDEIASKGNKGVEAENDGLVYELANDTTITAMKTSDSLVGEIDRLIENDEQAKARRLISNAILHRELTEDEENTLIRKLRIINGKLLTSTDADGDCKVVTIEKGQTLYAISKSNKMSVEAIAALNNMNPNKYNAGQNIKIYKKQFHLIVKLGKNVVYLWQDDHIVDRYDATVNDVRKGIYRLKAKKKGSLGEMIYTGKVFIAPDSTDLSTSLSIKLRDKDYEIVNMLLVTDAILQIQ